MLSGERESGKKRFFVDFLALFFTEALAQATFRGKLSIIDYSVSYPALHSKDHILVMNSSHS